MYLGKLLEGERAIVERADVKLLRRPHTELGLYDGYIKLPKAVAASLQIADWSVPGQFPKPPSYILTIDDPHFAKEAPKLAIYIDKIQFDDKSDLATITFLTQLPFD
jgi:hypothetical protein